MWVETADSKFKLVPSDSSDSVSLESASSKDQEDQGDLIDLNETSDQNPREIGENINKISICRKPIVM